MPALLANVLAVLALLLFLLAFPLALPLVALLNEIDRRRLRAAASRTRCLRCGQILGQASLDAADQACQAETADLRQRHPGLRLRLLRHCHALCTGCSMRYGWNERTSTLSAVPDTPWPPASVSAAPLP